MMAQAYTPGLTVAESITIRKERRLPLAGQVKVLVGDLVAAEQVVAETALPGNVTTINVAHDLNVNAEEVPRLMLKAQGDPVQAREPIAEHKALWGIFHAVSRSPIEGTVENISPVTGQVLIRGPAVPVELTAYIDGTVVEVLNDEGVVVECQGALIQGIIGIGGEAHGEIMIAVEHPAQPLTADLIAEDCHGKLIVGGEQATLDALQQAREVGAVGVVVGGIDAAVLDELLGETLGVAITGDEDVGITLIITEGFGKLPMAQRTFDLFRSHAGEHASLNGATQIRAGVIRPEVIIPHPATTEAPPEPAIMELRVGSTVRLIRDPYFGLLGTITALPEELQKIETESLVRVAHVRTDEGKELTVPRANIELIQQ